jgi:uncharacterized protein YlxW (UPF0749 family)
MKDKEIEQNTKTLKDNTENKDNKVRTIFDNPVYWLLFVLLIIVGVALASFINSIGEESEADEITRQYEEVEDELNALILNNEALLRQQKSLENNRRDLLNSLDLDDVGPELLAELDEARLLAGQEAVTGQGLIITLQDKEEFNPLTDSADALIHDGTITHVLNLLAGSGARAMSFNDIRITALPQIYCIGPTIRCFTRRMTPPYVILAIGPPEEMREALETDRYLQRITSIDVGVRLTIEEGQIIVPSFSEYDDYRKYITQLEVTRSED